MTEPLTERLAALAPSEQSRVGYLFWLSRPRFWLYLAGPVVVGVVYGADGAADLVTPLTVGLFLYFLVPANVFLYGINDVFDADVDEHNPKKSGEGREVTYRGDATVLVAVGLSAAVSVAFVPVLSVEGVAVLAVFLLLATEYSAPPLRLKTTPLLDSFSNGLYVLPGVLAFLVVSGQFPPVLAVAGGWLWSMAMHTFSAIPDIQPDREAGILTTATVLGERGAFGYCVCCWLAATVVMGVLHPFLGSVFAIYPLFVAVVALVGVDVDRAYWWFPILNTLAGTSLTLGGLWVVLYG